MHQELKFRNHKNLHNQQTHYSIQMALMPNHWIWYTPKFTNLQCSINKSEELVGGGSIHGMNEVCEKKGNQHQHICDALVNWCPWNPVSHTIINLTESHNIIQNCDQTFLRGGNYIQLWKSVITSIWMLAMLAISPWQASTWITLHYLNLEGGWKQCHNGFERILQIGRITANPILNVSSLRLITPCDSTF